MSLKEQPVYEELDTQWLKGEINADQYFHEIRTQVRKRNEEEQHARDSAMARRMISWIAIHGDR